MEGRRYKELLLKAGKGVVSYLGDFLLFMIIYGIESATAGYSASANGRAYARSTQKFLDIKEGTALRNLERLQGKGYISYARGKSDIEITEAGRARIERSVPVYESRRKWDGRLYLITYDVPEEESFVRNMLRDRLKLLGCGMLQKSVWLTPYDPREVLRDFVFEYHLQGKVLISSLGKGSLIGGSDFRNLLAYVYRLDQLNARYKKFLSQDFDHWPRFKVALEFYSILKDDPQLPFPLLPDDWASDEAFQKFSRLSHVRSHMN